MLAIVVHTAKAGITEAKLAVEKHPSIQRFCADTGYRKPSEKASSTPTTSPPRY